MDYSQFLLMHEELSLLAVILILFVADLFLCPDKKSGKGIYNTCLPVVLLGIHTALNLLPCSCANATEAFGGMYQYTPMMTIVKSVLSIGTLIVFLMAHKWLSRPENLVKQGEFYLLSLFTLLGMYFMIGSGHFLMFFIGLELASVPMTALIAFDKTKHESAEAGAKFILLALFSSALLLYGISLIYGATGSLYFDEISVLLDGSAFSIFGLVLFITGMGFKISLVPFHLWTADTYEGAPTSVTAFLSVISKGAAAFVLLTVFIKAFCASDLMYSWNTGLYWIIVASITVANLFAIRQNNLKRFMAFSAISQAGYLVLALMDGTAQGMTALVFYLLVYMVSNLGAFAVMTSVEENSGKILISDYDGLYATNPKLAFLMTLCLFSLAGIPPFAGFFSKFFIFTSAINQGSVAIYVLVLIALINTIVSLYYYLLVVKAMFISEDECQIAPFRSSVSERIGLWITVAGIIGLGIASCVYSHLLDIASVSSLISYFV